MGDIEIKCNDGFPEVMKVSCIIFRHNSECSCISIQMAIYFKVT